MAVQFPFGFKITSNEPIDARLVVTAAELPIAHQKYAMPDHYLAVCSTDDKLYIYDAANSVDPITGRFRVLQSSTPISDDETISVEVDPTNETKYILSIKGKNSAVDKAVLRKHIEGETISYTWDVIYSKTEVDTELAKKVDKVTGKSLIDDTKITKLDGIAEGATNVTASENGKIKINGVDTTVYTLPSDVVQDNNYIHTDYNFTSEFYTKLLDIENNAQVNKVEDVKVKDIDGIPASVVTDKVATIDISNKQNLLNDDNKLSLAYTEETSIRKFFTADNKTKLASIQEGAQVNDVVGVEVNNTSVVNSDKIAKLTVETNLDNDSTNPPTTKAVREYVATSIAQNSAIYVTSNVDKDNFSSHDALINAQHYYYNSEEYTPKNNDYAIVASDETHNNKQARYIYIVSTAGSNWNYQYSLGETFTAAQTAALNSGINADDVAKLDTIAEYATKATVTTQKTGFIEINGASKQVIPDNTVIDADYKHITVNTNYVSDGENTFNKYDDTALKNRVTSVENRATALETNVASLSTIVGDSNSGLVKGLAEEITRATTTENSLDTRITNLESRGRFLSTWNSETGKPSTYPETPEGTVFPQKYYYKSGDYYIVSVITTSGDKYKPTGNVITRLNASSSWEVPTVRETSEVGIGDYYTYDGTNWILVQNTTKTINFSAIAGAARDNANLKAEFETIEAALAKKVENTTTIAGIDLKDNITKAELLTAINVADGAQVNTIEKVKLNDTELSITDKTVNVEIDLTPYAKSADVATSLATKQNIIDDTHKLDYALIDNVPAIPTKTSQLTNDSKFVSPQSQVATSAGKVLKSIELTNGIGSDWGDVTIDRAFTTKVAVGNLPSGSSITKTMTIKDIIYAILCNRTLDRLEITELTTIKKTYKLGETFDKSGITVTAVYIEGDEGEETEVREVVPANEYSVSPLVYNTTIATVSYSGKSADINGITMQAHITGTLTKCTIDGESSIDTYVNIADGYLSSQMVITDKYELASDSLTVVGDCSATITNNKVSISNIHENIEFRVTAKAIKYAPVDNITNGTCQWIGSPYSVETVSGAAIIKPNAKFSYPTDVQIVGATKTSYEPTSGMVMFNDIKGQVTITATCVAATINNLALNTTSATTTYRVGQTLNLTNVKAILTYNDTQTPQTTEIVDYPWTGYDITVTSPESLPYVFTESDIPSKSIIISGYGYTTSYVVACENKTVTGIHIDTLPTMPTGGYTTEKFSTDGLKVSVIYDDSTTKEVTSGFVTNPAQDEVIVTKDTLDTYKDFTVAYTADPTIKDITTGKNAIYIKKLLTSVSKTTDPTLTYIQGQNLDLTGLELTAKFNELDTAIQSVTYETSGCACSIAHGTRLVDAGTQSLIVTYTYGDVSKANNYNITVNSVNYQLTGAVLNGSAAKEESTWIYGDTGYIQLTANEGYVLPTSISQANISGATYDSYAEGKIKITNITNNVELINIECPEATTVVPWYVGNIAGITKKVFAEKTSDELIANATVKSKTDLTYTWTPTATKDIFYVIMADGIIEPSSGSMVSGGLTTPFTAADFTDESGTWKGTNAYPDFTLNNQLYHVYRIYSSGWNVGSDTVTVNVKVD